MKKPSVQNNWVVICDAGHGRIFSTSGKNSRFELVQKLENPRGRLLAQDIMADAPGRVQESAAKGRRSAMEPSTDPKELEAQHFAHKLAEILDKGLGEGAYSRLILAAPPHFLGLMRKELSEEVQKRLMYSIDHDYTWVEEHELPSRFQELL